MQKYDEAPWWWYILLLLSAFFAGVYNRYAFTSIQDVMALISGAIIPPRAMFVAQIWGTIIGAIVKYVVMISITGAQRDLLLNPTGNNIWSGQTELYGLSGPYFIIPMGIFIGFAATVRWPRIGPVRVNQVILPIIFQYSAWMYAGVNSVVSSTIIVGLVSQLWLRRYHPGWYRKYNYILGGALDGGAQVMIFILSFAVFGASGVSRPGAGNPAKGNVDYCNANGALKCGLGLRYSKGYLY
ncbi:OPT oligopeptide transporter protein-domain-containing protein [Lactarius vividus]|nr:OPT oligopeptide transporter protein-domain-containing protein [Lactarius vividus]